MPRHVRSDHCCTSRTAAARGLDRGHEEGPEREGHGARRPLGGGIRGARGSALLAGFLLADGVSGRALALSGGALAIGAAAWAIGPRQDDSLHRGARPARRLDGPAEPHAPRGPRRAGARTRTAHRQRVRAHPRRPRRLQGGQRLRGHRAGDAVLKTIARRLESVVRASDTVARVGGDESSSSRSTRGTRSRPQPWWPPPARAATAVPVEGATVEIDASLGWALFPTDATSDELLARADGQMYATKRETGETTPRRLDGGIVREFELALESREVVVHYQPVLELRSGAVRTVEALVRRRTPTAVSLAGRVPPARRAHTSHPRPHAPRRRRGPEPRDGLARSSWSRARRLGQRAVPHARRRGVDRGSRRADGVVRGASAGTDLEVVLPARAPAPSSTIRC